MTDTTQLIQQIYSHWERQGRIVPNDHSLYQIIRSYPASTHRATAQAFQQVIRDGYHHEQFSSTDCEAVCEAQQKACEDPQWDHIMSTQYKERGRWLPHPHKSTQWKFWRMVCEIMSNNIPRTPQEQLFEVEDS